MPHILSNEWFIDKWEKLNASIWTRMFIITSIIQTILIIVLESRVLYRNDSTRKHIEGYKGKPTCDVQYSMDRMMRIEQENIVFIIFQIYQLWFCFDVVFAQNTIQLMAVTIMNSICAGYSIVQIVELRIWYTYLKKSCPHILEKGSNATGYDLPLVITSMLFATIMAFLAFHLYQQFGWIIYRKIGGSIEIQTMYRRQLILVILLKVDLFFLLLFSIEFLVTFARENHESNEEKLESLYYIPQSIYHFHRVVTVSIIFLEFIVYRSMRKEWRSGMLAFIFLWIVVIADLIILLIVSIKTAKDSWYFLICFVVVSVIISIVTWIYSILVTKDFNKGLKEILGVKRSSKLPANSVPRMLSLD